MFELDLAYGGQLKKFLQEKESLSLHKQRRTKFTRRKIFATGPFVGLQADTIHYRSYGRLNSGYKYILGRFHK